MRLSESIDHLLEADADRDAKFRKKASAIWVKILKRGKAIANNNEFYDLDTTTVVDSKRRRVTGRRFMVRDKELGRVFVVLLPHKGVDAGITRVATNMWVLALPVLVAADDPKWLETRITSGRDDVIHELTHAFDMLRGMVSGAAGAAVRRGDEDGYYNSPEEFNAYYQSGANKIEDFFDPPEGRPAKNHELLRTVVGEPQIRKGYRQWEKWALGWFDKDWVKATMADKVYSRKLKKRLYGLFNRLKKVYMSESQLLEGYYNYSRGMTIKDVLSRWVAGDKLYDPDKIDFKSFGKTNKVYAHGLISVRELQKYREFKRPLQPSLVRSIKENGFNTELYVIVGRDGKAKIGEGNHRLVAAIEAGLEELPVYFQFYEKGG